MFGKDDDRVVKLDTEHTRLYVAKRGEAGGVEITHDEASAEPGLALLLARCAPPEFPTPVGVLRSVSEATFEDQTLAQNRAAIAARGEHAEGLLCR